MIKCSSPLCNVMIQPRSSSPLVHGGVCRSCRKQNTKDVYELACDTIPSARTRLEWEAIRDTVAEKMRCVLAQGESVQHLERMHTQAVDALSAMPVSICPMELVRLQRRDTELARIEEVIAPCLNPHHNHSGADTPAGRLVHWLQQSSVLLGRRF